MSVWVSVVGAGTRGLGAAVLRYGDRCSAPPPPSRPPESRPHPTSAPSRAHARSRAGGGAAGRRLPAEPRRGGPAVGIRRGTRPHRLRHQRPTKGGGRARAAPGGASYPHGERCVRCALCARVVEVGVVEGLGGSGGWGMGDGALRWGVHGCCCDEEDPPHLSPLPRVNHHHRR